MTRRALPLLILAMAVASGSAAHAERDPMAEPRFVTAAGTTEVVGGVITALTQDEQGMIWFGTSVSLVRYDGYQAKAYPTASPGKDGSHVNRAVRALLPDKPGVLWVGSSSDGLARFDTQTERWSFFNHDPAQASSIGTGTVVRLAHTGDGHIWVGLWGGGIDRFDPRRGTFEHHRAADGQGLPDDRISALRLDRRGDLWVGTWKGLAHLRANGARFEPVAGIAQPINALTEDAQGRIWAGTRDGQLFLVDPATAAVRPLDVATGAHPSPVLSLLSVGPDEVWVGRVNSVEMRTIDGRLLQTLERNQRKPWALNGTDFHALLLDRSGTVWVGGYGGGLQHFDPRLNGLWVRRQDETPNSPLADPDVRSVLQLRSGEIWLGTLERGIAVMDRQLRSVATVPTDERFSGLIAAMAQAADDEVFVGTDGGKLYRFDARRHLQQTLAVGPRVRRLFVDAAGRLWIGTSDGLFRLDPGAREVVRISRAGAQRLGGNINAIVTDREGVLWAGGDQGLFHADQGEMKPLEARPELAKAAVLGLLCDARGTLWVDTNLGLLRRPSGAGFEVAMPLGSAESSFGANLLDDAQGRIWTYHGVFDPATRTWTEFDKSDGVDIGTGWFRSYSKLDDGRMLFGGSTGILVVEPEHFRRWAFQPPVVATSLRIDNRPYPSGEMTQGLKLDAHQRAFSIQFSALDYSTPTRNQYRYRLQGYDDDWVATTAALRVASYANLAPGHYTLEVQGSNRVGDWSDKPLRIPVEVQPAWWQTWWAKTLDALLMMLGIYGLVRWRTHTLERRQALLERRVQERTAELETLTESLRQKSLALEEKTIALEASSYSDPLTGLHNRRYLTQHIDSDVAIALRRTAAPSPNAGGDLVFLMVDIDHFKQINDVHGHSAGDAVLVQMRDRLRQVFREGDHVVRWGGEEFLVVVRDSVRTRAPEMAERLRCEVADRPFMLPDGTAIARTCSIGFACFPLSGTSPQALEWSAVIDIADGALYEAKRSGRNRWVGVSGADASLSAEALRELVRRAPGEWLGSAALEVLRSTD